MIEAVITIQRHLDICDYFQHRISNAVVEGLKSKIQLIKAATRGFRNFENFRIAILFHGGGLKMWPPRMPVEPKKKHILGIPGKLFKWKGVCFLYALLFLNCTNANRNVGANREVIKKSGKEYALIESKGLCQVEGASNIGYAGSDSSFHFFQEYDKRETHRNGEILFAVPKDSLRLNFEYDFDTNDEEKSRIISKLDGAEFICNKKR